MISLTIITMILVMLFSPIDWLIAKFGIDLASAWAIGGLTAVVAAWLIKRIPNDTLKIRFGALMYGLGITVTLGLAHWKYTERIWNKVIEPWVIDAIDNIIVNGITEFIRGMRSDNE